MPCAPHLPGLNHWRRMQARKVVNMHLNRRPVISSRFCPNIVLSSQFSSSSLSSRTAVYGVSLRNCPCNRPWRPTDL
jgi:hypothetical protein